MPLTIPDFSLVLMMGASGSGKSTFAARHFSPTEILSSDRCRGMVADAESDQAATGDAFDVLYYIAAKRLASRRLTVIDATNLRAEDRKHAIELARRYHALPVIFALDVPETVCAERNRTRPDRAFGLHVVRNHVRLLRRSLRGLQREGFRVVHALSSTEAIANAKIMREPLFTDRRTDTGPFDIVGDVHGCLRELTSLLRRLGYASVGTEWRHPDGRRAIFLGDLVDRGPDSPGVLRLVMDMVAAGAALCVQGNHDNKLHRKLSGRDVKVNHGLAETLAQIEALPDADRPAFIAESRAFLDTLRSHYWLDGGKLVVAHAGLKADMHGRGSGSVRSFALYGETTGETDEFGLPVRYEWARDYRGEAMVVYGHTPVPVPEWVNRTICIDT
ncbi:MAG: AAA family ATPase, partial [Acetobacteraceae bacterium]